LYNKSVSTRAHCGCCSNCFSHSHPPKQLFLLGTVLANSVLETCEKRTKSIYAWKRLCNPPSETDVLTLEIFYTHWRAEEEEFNEAPSSVPCLHCIWILFPTLDTRAHVCNHLPTVCNNSAAVLCRRSNRLYHASGHDRHSMDNPSEVDFFVGVDQRVSFDLQTNDISSQDRSLICPQRKKYHCPTLWTSQLQDWEGWWAGWWFTLSIHAVLEWTWQVPLAEVHRSYPFCLTLYPLWRIKECRRCTPAWGLVCCVRFSTPLLALDSSKCSATSLLSIDPRIFYLDLLQALLPEVCYLRNYGLRKSTSTWHIIFLLHNSPCRCD